MACGLTVVVRVLGRGTFARGVLGFVSCKVAESVCETGEDPGMSHFRPIPGL